MNDNAVPSRSDVVLTAAIGGLGLVGQVALMAVADYLLRFAWMLGVSPWAITSISTVLRPALTLALMFLIGFFIARRTSSRHEAYAIAGGAAVAFAIMAGVLVSRYFLISRLGPSPSIPAGANIYDALAWLIMTGVAALGGLVGQRRRASQSTAEG